MMIRTALGFLAALTVCFCCLANSVWDPRYQPAGDSPINPQLLNQRWTAAWIGVPGNSPFDYGVYHFRRSFNLDVVPQSFVVHATADNRYELFVNGKRVSWGPARGDLHHWRYETIQIAPYLQSGKNVLAAVVWNYAQYAPEAQVTNQTGFLLQGNTEVERIVDTGPGWKCLQNAAYRPLHYTHAQMRGYFVVGPGDYVDARAYPWGWELIEFDDGAWQDSRIDSRGAGSPWGVRDAGNRWMLVPRSIPSMEETPERLVEVRQVSGIVVPPGFPANRVPLAIPANSSVRMILDQAYLTTAFPELVISGGKGARLLLGYAESLYERGARRGDKGDRNAVEGKEFVGFYDEFVADGGPNRMFRPLWWRTYRYLELKVETGEEPLRIEDLRAIYVGYPFEMKARLETGDPRISKFLEIGWRTARLCAHETYMDCPYYEQLQYAGDTRIQGLISIYNSGDARLLKNAIAQLDDSRTPEGLTLSRAPTRQQQYIPPFSLWWIGMVHDYWMYLDDPGFVRQTLPGVRSVLGYFASYQKDNGSLRRMPFWNYSDWAPEWQGGVPPIAEDGSSAPLDLQLLLAYDWAAAMEQTLGSARLADEYRQSAAGMRGHFKGLYWDEKRQMFADTPARQNFAQFTNALAVLARVVEGEPARALVNRVVADREIVQCTYYSAYYLNAAVHLVGEGDRYSDLLAQWDDMITQGMTTWAERPPRASNPPRSDCHAWSAHPNFEFFRTLLGVDSAAPGFRRVVVRPFLGKLQKVSGSIPHPNGEISVSLKRKGAGLEAEVSLPEGVEGEFHWQGQTRKISPGVNHLMF
jgi:alpha-L-rhamnosidase